MRLLTLHNLHFLIDLTRQARSAILDGNFQSWAVGWLARFRQPRASAADTLTNQ
jgi:tRNA-guanine family transglycosylase